MNAAVWIQSSDLQRDQALEQGLQLHPSQLTLATLLTKIYHALHRLPEAVRLQEVTLDMIHHQLEHGAGQRDSDSVETVRWYVGQNVERTECCVSPGFPYQSFVGSVVVRSFSPSRVCGHIGRALVWQVAGRQVKAGSLDSCVIRYTTLCTVRTGTTRATLGTHLRRTFM